jgi:uncharacterized protein with PQ loop repeat
MNTLAWFGSILLGVCSVPELIKTLRTKTCTLTWSFLLLWFFGEVFVLVPVLAKDLGAFLVFNYSLNTLIIGVLLYYKIKEGVWKSQS